jgi:peptidoglycan L-alanyl-D-glutamate endopeptidase CwlK
MSSRRLTDLDHDVYLLAERALLAWEARKLNVLIYCTYRSEEEQAALYAQGRASLNIVNKMRKDCGLYSISEKENSRKVTNAKAGQSMHNKRRAFDCVPLIAGKPQWSKSSAIWQEVGAIGESVGLEWAGRWRTFCEYPHFQLSY